MPTQRQYDLVDAKLSGATLHLVLDANSVELTPGETIRDFRGQEHTLESFDHRRVYTDKGCFFPEVFDVKVVAFKNGERIV